MFRAHWPILLTASILSSCDSPTSQTDSDPTLATISPNTTVAGSSDVTLSVTGTRFDNAAHHRSQVVWQSNGSNTPLTTAFVSSTQLTAVIPAALLSNVTTARVFVQAGDPVSDTARSRSNALGFRVVEASQLVWPAIAISPTSAVAGRRDLELTIHGSSFVAAGAPPAQSGDVGPHGARDELPEQHSADSDRPRSVLDNPCDRARLR